jgi:hypothetical protein
MKSNLKRSILIKIIAAALFISVAAGLGSCSTIYGYPEAVHQNANWQFTGSYGLPVPAWKNLGDEWLIIENHSDLPDAIVGRKAAEIIKIRNDLERDCPWLSDRIANPKLKIIFAKGDMGIAGWYSSRTPGTIYFSSGALFDMSLPGELRRILLHEYTHLLQYELSVGYDLRHAMQGMRPDVCIALNNAKEFFADFYSRVYSMNFPKDSPNAKKILSKAMIDALDPNASWSRISWMSEYGGMYTQMHFSWEQLEYRASNWRPEDVSWAIQEKNSAPYILYAMRLLADAKDKEMPSVSDETLWRVYGEMHKLGTGQSRYSSFAMRKVGAKKLDAICSAWDSRAAEFSGGDAHEKYLFLSGRSMGD